MVVCSVVYTGALSFAIIEMYELNAYILKK